MNSILEETEWQEYDSRVFEDVPARVAPTSSSETTQSLESPFLIGEQFEPQTETQESMPNENQESFLNSNEYLVDETEKESWRGENYELDPYAGIRAAMSPEHANLTADEVTLRLGRMPATLVLHQFLDSDAMRQAALASLLGNAGRRSVRVHGMDIAIPAYLRLVGRLCREVADHSEAEYRPEQESLTQDEAQILTASVGRNGVNQPNDVRLVQRLINAQLPVPLAPLVEDGICGPKTIFAIETYQQRVVGMNPPDGRVDPDGSTFRFLTGGIPIPVKPAPTPPLAAGYFPPEVISGAQASHQKWNIPASVTVAQWALESNWGRSMPSGSNNPFGIKAAAGEPYVEARTREVINGKSVYITAKFRKFDSMNDAFDQHGKLLATGKPYARARTFAADPDGFADALTGVYATDPRYGSVLKSLMKKYNLYQYD